MNAGLGGSGIVDAVIAIAVLEAIVLVGYRWRTGRGIAIRRLLPNLAAGLLLMFGVRVALVGEPWPWLPVCLAAAGVAHLVDLRLRWDRADRLD